MKKFTFFILLLTTILASCSKDKNKISGQIRGEHGGPVCSAIVCVFKPNATDYSYKTRTNGQGWYEISDIKDGCWEVYAIRRSGIGYSDGTSEVFELSKREKKTINLIIGYRGIWDED